MIINDDCLNALKNIEDSSVDLVLTDPPYGTITNTPTGWNRDTSWDVVLDQNKVWSELNRVCRPGANIIFFKFV